MLKRRLALLIAFSFLVPLFFRLAFALHHIPANLERSARPFWLFPGLVPLALLWFVFIRRRSAAERPPWRALFCSLTGLYALEYFCFSEWVDESLQFDAAIAPLNAMAAASLAVVVGVWLLRPLKGVPHPLYRRKTGLVGLLLGALLIGGVYGGEYQLARRRERKEFEIMTVAPEPGLLGHPPDSAPCEPTAGVILALIRLERELRVDMGGCGGARGPETEEEDWRGRAQQVLEGLETLDLSKVTPVERAVAQSALLRVIRCGPYEHAQPLRRSLAKWIQPLALSPKELKALGTEPEAMLAGWLPSPTQWKQRRGLMLLFHEMGYKFTRAFRLLQIDDKGVNFSQLVVAGTDGIPHITSIVGEVETRRPLKTRAEGAFALELDYDHLHCATQPGLRPVDPGKMNFHSGFISSPDGRRFACNTCHGEGVITTQELLSADQAEYLLKRRQAFLKAAAQSLQTARDGKN